MSDVRQTQSMTTEELFSLLLYQANQFELFKGFIIEVLDLKGVIKIEEFHELFKQYKEMNKTKPLQNLMMLKPKLADVKIDLSLIQ